MTPLSSDERRLRREAKRRLVLRRRRIGALAFLALVALAFALGLISSGALGGHDAAAADPVLSGSTTTQTTQTGTTAPVM